MTSKRKFAFNISGTSYKIAVEKFKVEEQISQLYEVSLELVSKDKIHFDTVIRKEALLTIVGKDEDRYFHGIINNFMLTGKVDTFYTYQATVVPKVWLLGLNQDFRIFQNMTVQEIVTKIFDEKQIPSDEFEFKLKSKYEPRRYCTQYGENDYRFISRILEEEGIFFFFEHDEDSHTLVFSDSEDVYKPIEGEAEMDFNSYSNMVAEKETIKDFGYNRSICPGKVIHTNYNFKRPTLGMEVSEEGETHVNHKIYEYPGDYGLPPEGAPKAQQHLEQVKSLEESAQGTSNCSRFIPGFTFSISDHPFDDLNDDYCLVMVEHKGNQPNVYGENSGIGGDYSYSNYFIAIPADTVYRTRKTLKKPYVRGIQSAIVTGPKGEEIHTDEYGRIKVQFHWDRDGKKDEKSSCWLRTSQHWSGNGWGLVSLPRIGDEVLVDFMNGDPDWPIMVGTVNNAASPALYDLPANKTQSGIKTRSTPGGGVNNFNELRFEDKEGAEEVYLQAEKDCNILVKSNKGQTIGGSSTTNVTKSLSNSAEDITLTAKSKITLICGGSTIVLDPSGVKINGVRINMNG